MNQPKLFFLPLLCCAILLLAPAALQAQNPNPDAYTYTSMSEAVSVIHDIGSKFDVTENGVTRHFVTTQRSDGYLKPDSVAVIILPDSVTVAVLQAPDIEPEWFKKSTETDWYNAFQRMTKYVNARGGGLTINLRQGYNYLMDTMKIYQVVRDTTITITAIVNNGADTTGAGVTHDTIHISDTTISIVSNDIANIEFKNVSNLIINGNGATISVKGNFKRKATRAIGRGLYMSYYNSVVPLVISDAKNIVIRDLHFNGNVQQMTMDANVVEGDSYGIKLQGVQNGVLTNVVTENFATDGLLVDLSPYTKHTCRNINATNVISEHNGRQGLTVAGQLGGTYTNCRFSFSGDSLGAYFGHAPKAGVDIEPSFAASDAPYCGDIRFVNCTFEGNVGTAITAALAIDRNITVEGGVLDNRLHNSPYVAIMGIYNFVMSNTTVYTGTGNLYPAWGIGKGQMSTLKDLTMYSNSSGIIAAVDAEYGCTIDHINLTGQHTAPFASYFPYIRSSKVTFKNNYVFMDSAMYGGSNKALVQYCALSQNNTYATNLDTTGGRYFTVTSAGAKTTQNESFPVNGAVKSFEAGTWTPTIGRTTGDVSGGSRLVMDNGLGTPTIITYGSGIPATGKYNVGDIIRMRAPLTAGFAYYVCTVSGDAALGTAQFAGVGGMAAGGASVTYKTGLVKDASNILYVGESYKLNNDLNRSISTVSYPDSAVYTTGATIDTGAIVFKVPTNISSSPSFLIEGTVTTSGKGSADFKISGAMVTTSTFFNPKLNISGDTALLATKVRLLKDAGGVLYISFFDTTSTFANKTTIQFTRYTINGTVISTLIANAALAWSTQLLRSFSGYTLLNTLTNTSEDYITRNRWDGNDMLTLAPAAGATDALIAQRTLGANVNQIRMGGSDGRTIGTYQNGVLSNLNFSANQVVFNSTLKVGAAKALAFASYDGTQTGYVVINPDAGGSLNVAVNGINAIGIGSTGRTGFGGAINLKSYTVATLPAAPFVDDVCIVSDASSPVNGAPVVGGGTTIVPVYRNATNWIVMGAAATGGGSTLLQRSGTTLSPLTAGDNFSTTGTGTFGKVKLTAPATGTIAMKQVMWDSADSTLKTVSATATSGIDQSFAGSFTSDGTLAASPVSLKYSWSSEGKLTTLKIRFKWTTPSGTMTTVSFPLPSDCPAPAVPTDVTGDNQILTAGTIVLQPSNNASLTLTDNTKLVLKKLAASPSGFQLEADGSSFSYQGFFITIIYQNQ